MTIRTKIVPALVVLLGLAAIAATTMLEQRADEGHDALLTLANLETELQSLQTVPFRAQRSTGGDPVLAGRLLREGEKMILGTLAELRRDDPPAQLGRVSGPLDANFVVLGQIYELGATGVGYEQEADLLGSKSSRLNGTVSGLLDEAGREYDRRAERAHAQARVGAAGAILVLLLAFGFIYRRSVLARAMAEDLAAENHRLLAASREEALTDALTGLRNRRALVIDLQAVLPRATGGTQIVLALFDLDGFKQYNDTFGHPAGDTLLTRLGERLSAAVEGDATAYRMGGDEFCVLALTGPEGGAETVRRAEAALTDAGEAFSIQCSYGTAIVPAEAASPEAALQLADQRLYEHKAGRSPTTRETTDVLVQVLSERGSGLEEHLSGVARLARLVAERLGLPDHEVKRIRLAAELHDVGKTAIPDAILSKPDRLDEEEWDFVRRHTVIGERILLAAPSLADTARLVRASHERVDGRGYPDALVGREIPLGALIIAACDAFDAMVSERPYRSAMTVTEALAELQSCAGTQFDPGIVDIVCAVVEELERGRLRAAGQPTVADAA